MVDTFTVVVIAAYSICISTPYIINGPSPSGASPSPAVYICQASCPQKCAPECLPTCCNPMYPKTNYNVLSDLSPTLTDTEIVYPGQPQKSDASISPPITSSWKSPSGCGEKDVNNNPAQRQSSARPDIMIQSIEEGETKECEDKGFYSPTDNSKDPPGTITIPLPATVYTPPRAGEAPTELPLPEFQLPSTIFQGKFPQESMTLTPVNDGKTKAAPVMPPAPAVPAPAAPPPVPAASAAPAPIYPLVYPKLPPVTTSEIPIRTRAKQIAASSSPMPPQPTTVFKQPPPVQITSVQAPPVKYGTGAPSIQTSTNVMSPQSVVTPQLDVSGHNKASVQPSCPPSQDSPVVATVSSPVIIDTSCDPRCDDPEEYECMVKEMKEALDTRYPETHRRRLVVKPTG